MVDYGIRLPNLCSSTGSVRQHQAYLEAFVDIGAGAITVFLLRPKYAEIVDNKGNYII